MRSDLQLGSRSSGLVDILDRVLDKGLVVAGDVKISLAEVELLTIRIRLIVCSIDKAQAIGLDWWKNDHHLAPGAQPLLLENEELKRQIQVMERRIASLEGRRVAVAPHRAQKGAVPRGPRLPAGSRARAQGGRKAPHAR